MENVLPYLIYIFFNALKLLFNYIYFISVELSSDRKLELIPDTKELAECLTEFTHNELFGVLLRTSEEAARRSISGREGTKVT